jgi:hypothetical protein
MSLERRFTPEQEEQSLRVDCPACGAPRRHGCMMIVWSLRTKNSSLQERHPHARRILKSIKYPNLVMERKAEGDEHVA